MDKTLPKITRKTSPYLRRPQANVTRMMRDVTIALLPVTIFAIYKFGWDAVIILLLSIVSMVVTEYIYYQVQDMMNKEEFSFKNKSFTIYNYSAVTSGLIYGLTLPDNTPWFTVIIGGAIGIFLAKLVFGGMGQNVFNPAAVARLVVIVNFGTMVSYDVDAVAGATPLMEVASNVFSTGVLENFSLVDLFTGIGIPGSMGEMSAVLLILGGVYLALRTSFEVRIPLMFVGTVAILALATGLYLPDLNPIDYMLFHVLSGGLLFGAIFMATDPITSPITQPGRIAFGFALGVVTFFIRVFGAYPEGVVFSILIMNMFVATFDYYKWSSNQYSTKRVLYFLAVFAVVILVTLVGVYYAG